MTDLPEEKRRSLEKTLQLTINCVEDGMDALEEWHRVVQQSMRLDPALATIFIDGMDELQGILKQYLRMMKEPIQ